MGIIAEFKEFLAEYKVVGLAVAFIIGAAVTSLVTSLCEQHYAGLSRIIGLPETGKRPRSRSGR